MPKVKVASFSISIDGFGAGPRQDLQNPLGVRGTELHNWFFQTEVFNKITGHPNMVGDRGGTTGIDNQVAAKSFENVGAWILGRNMFGPVRGPWVVDPSTGDLWKGWWGPNPPYHVPVFVLTHHARAPIAMEGGTTFHFVTEGIHAALGRAKEAAEGKDVRLGGGVSTMKQYLGAGLVDDMHFAISPALIGQGERLFQDLNLPDLGYEIKDHTPSPGATHVKIGKRA